MSRSFEILLAVAALVATLVPTSVVAATDVEHARELASSGQRDEAIRLLQDRLSAQPEDTDARTLLGTVLSWEGQYDEARNELNSVLKTNPTHADALPALYNVEMWSGHPDRAEALAARGLAAKPNDVTLLNDHARALYAMGKAKEALAECERVLAIDPDNKTARDLRDRARATSSLWRVGLVYTYDHLSPDGDDWHETDVSLKRQLSCGPIIGHWSHAWRYGLTDDQFEVEAYPRIRPGTYAWVDAGWSPHADLYPTYRIAFDVYQSLPAGFEISIGYRRLGFDEDVNIYVATIGNYWRSWLFSGRVFVTPDVDGTSMSYSLAARNFFGNGLAYYGFRYSWGRSPEEIRDLNTLAVLHSKTIAAELSLPLRDGWTLDARASYGKEDRVSRDDLDHLSATVGAYYDF